MLTRKLALAVVAGTALLAASPAFADNRRHDHGWHKKHYQHRHYHGHYHYAPAPVVVYRPAPVYYAPPPPRVVYRPVYVAPRPTVVYSQPGFSLAVGF